MSQQHHLVKSVRRPLIPSEDELDKQEESFVGSLRKLLLPGIMLSTFCIIHLVLKMSIGIASLDID